MGNANSKSSDKKAKEVVNRVIRDNNVVIFSKRSCAFCVAAKRTLLTEAKRLSRSGCSVPQLAVVELDDGSLSPQVARKVQGLLLEMTGASTVPRVFVNQVFVGGAAETLKYSRNGALRFALMKAGKCDVRQHELGNQLDLKSP